MITNQLLSTSLLTFRKICHILRNISLEGYINCINSEEFQREGVTIIINGRNVPSAVSKQLLEQLTVSELNSVVMQVTYTDGVIPLPLQSFPCKIKEVYLMKTSGPFGLKRSVVNDAIAKRIHVS